MAVGDHAHRHGVQGSVHAVVIQRDLREVVHLQGLGIFDPALDGFQCTHRDGVDHVLNLHHVRIVAGSDHRGQLAFQIGPDQEQELHFHIGVLFLHFGGDVAGDFLFQIGSAGVEDAQMGRQFSVHHAVVFRGSRHHQT